MSVGVQIETIGALVRHITPQHETRNNVSIHSFQRGCCNLLDKRHGNLCGGLGFSFLAAVIMSKTTGVEYLIQGCFILNFRC
jgi:hypothetical protein